MEYTIHKLASLAGVTSRTLRYYDQIHLLKPSRVTEAGYRVYGPAEVDRLQHILFYRELGVGLPLIAAFLDEPDFDRGAALRDHLQALERERNRIDALILTVTHSIEQEKGTYTMTDSEKFMGFKRETIQKNEAQYGAEIRANYGDGTIDASNRRFENLTEEAYQRMTEMGEEIQVRLEEAVQSGAAPAGEEGAAIAALHRQWLSFTWAEYSPQAHAGLARMYVEDPRFTAYYDGSVPGCAAFLRDAVLAYTDKEGEA